MGLRVRFENAAAKTCKSNFHSARINAASKCTFAQSNRVYAPKREFAVPERIHEPLWLRQVGVHKSGRGVKTMKKILGCLSVAAVAVLLAAPVSAQILTLRVSVPFDFVVGGHTLPAGDYLVSKLTESGVLELRNLSNGATPIAITSSVPGQMAVPGEASLTFHRYGADYFLAEIWDGYTGQGRSIWMSRTEREIANRASLSKPGMVMVLARR
jgi:hypothetical protein